MSLYKIKVKYDKDFVGLIETKLSGKYRIYDDVIMKMVSTFYKFYCPKNEKTPTIDFYNNYSYKSSKSLKKYIMISLNADFDFRFDKDFIDYDINNDEFYTHYGFDNVNNIFFFEKRFYLIYDLLFSDKLKDKTHKVINFLDIIAVYYDEEYNSFYISKHPIVDEIFDNNFTEKSCIEEKFLLNRMNIPKWLYCRKPDELNIDKYITLHNADIKAEFIKKAGVDKLISMGKIVDSYENYPDNEWWAKSEYKLIDMHSILPPRKVITYYEWRTKPEIKTKQWKYAPFLYMRNQTTGVIHLEGISPKCRNLYDALRMRYKGLNLPNYDIKDIK